ncbi:TRN1 [Auxenochlorella protothecoides x Auxenochlorella symbiontica]
MSSPGSDWQPSPGIVNELVGLLLELQNPSSNQSQVLARLDAARGSPDYTGYLAFIFSAGEGLSLEVRQTAGLLLKNGLTASPPPPISRQAWAQLQSGLLRMLRHEARPLRHTAGTCVAAAVGVAGLPHWPELVPSLAGALAPEAPLAATEGALDTLFKLTEEHPRALEERGPGDAGAAPNDTLLPAALRLFAHPSPGVRAGAVAALNLAATGMPAFLCEAMDDYLQGLFGLAHDGEPTVRRDVCAGLVQALTLAPERLQSSLPQLIEYMLGSTQDGDEAVAIESCEFWSALCEYGDDATVLRPFLPRLLPVLLSNMVFEEHDDEVAEAEAAEQGAAAAGVGHAAERAADIKPFVGRTGGGGGEGDPGDEDSEDEEVARWNLRRCSASALDMLSTTFGDELLPIVLPTIHQRLQEHDWRAQEASILALGAISQGCTTGLAPHLQDLVGMLLPATASPRPMVRCIASWALARYSRWMFGCVPGSSTVSQATVTTVVQTLAQRCLDANPVVQKAACGSLATLVELGGDGLPPSELAAIAAALAAAVQRYGRRTLRHAYDAIATLAERVGGALGVEGAARDALLPPLFSRLLGLPDGDPELLPLLECLTAVAQACPGQVLDRYAEPSFGRCVGLVAAAQAGVASGALEEEEGAQIQVCALDFVAGLVESLGPSVESLVGNSPLLDLAQRACTPPSPPDVRQAAFALVGDLAAACAPHLRPRLRQLAGAAVEQLAPPCITGRTISACNNAAWAMGELTVRCTGEEVAPVAQGLLERYVGILLAGAGQLPRSLRENAAISLGRLALVCPGPLAPHASHFVAQWCSVLAGVRDGEEKEHSVRGLCALLAGDAGPALQAFVPLCAVLASWKAIPGAEVLAESAQLLQGLKAQLQAMSQWDAAMRSLSPAVAQKLAAVYGV